MTIVDSHVHLWDPARHDHSWLRNGGEAGLQRAFTLADLAAAMSEAAPRTPGDMSATRSTVSGEPVSDHEAVVAVCVQAGKTAAEGRWLVDLAAGSDRIAGVVLYGDLHDAALPDRIDEMRAAVGGSTIVGLRDPVATRSGARLDVPQLRRSLAGLGERDLAVDLLLGQGTLPGALTLARELPQTRLVVDHAAISAVDVRREGLQEWAIQLSALSRLPNVVCKLSGLGKATAGTAGVRLDDVVRVVLDAFGPHRLMFGSDWPVSALWSAYGGVIEKVASVLAGLTADETAAVWGGTATQTYRL